MQSGSSENQEVLPVSIVIYNAKKAKSDINKFINLIFVLKDRCRLEVQGRKYDLKEKDLFLINSFTAFSIEQNDKNYIVLIQIDPEYFDKYYRDFSKLRFNIDIKNEDEKQRLDYLKSLIAKIVKASYKKKTVYAIEVNKLAFQIALILINKYKTKEDNKHDRCLVSIVKFVLCHYKENFNLNDIANIVYLNPQYVSRYFSKQMGITLKKYVANIRLQASINDIEKSENKITDIALQYGFPNFKSYFKAFKSYFELTPLEYRKKYLKQKYEKNKSDIIVKNIDDEFLLKNLYAYLNIKYEENEILPENRENHIINYKENYKKFNKTWNKLIGFERASEGLRAEWQNQLKKIQNDISFEYIRFHGIFSDEMMIYNEDEEGKVYYNFNYVDELIDFLLSVKIKPFIELSFMPEQLASRNEHTFLWKANISYPKNIKKWCGLVKSFIAHIISKYGSEEVEKWYFEIWNEPDYKNKYYPSTENVKFSFFKDTFNSIKMINSKLKVGGLNVFHYTILNTNIVKNFMDFCKKECIMPDFISFSLYPIISVYDDRHYMNKLKEDTEKIYNTSYIPQTIIESCKYAPENYTSDVINIIVKKLRENSFKKEIFITEWNSNPDPTDLLNDTCFKAPFVVKNIIENCDKVSGMAYWTFTDIFEEVKSGASIFHGGLGFITSNGLKKPAYYVYEMLNKLGNVIIQKGEDYIVTKKGNESMQILVWNYCDFDGDLKCNNSVVNTYDRYSVFDEKIKKICFEIKGLKCKALRKIYKINKKNGSSYDKWLEIGAPSYLNEKELGYLEMSSIYYYKTDEIDIGDGFKIVQSMEPNEVMLIDISFLR